MTRSATTAAFLMISSAEVYQYLSAIRRQVQKRAMQVYRTDGMGRVDDSLSDRLEQIGLEALLSAAETFDQTRGAKLWTYGQYRVKGAMDNYFKSEEFQRLTAGVAFEAALEGKALRDDRPADLSVPNVPRRTRKKEPRKPCAPRIERTIAGDLAAAMGCLNDRQRAAYIGRVRLPAPFWRRSCRLPSVRYCGFNSRPNGRWPSSSKSVPPNCHDILMQYGGMITRRLAFRRPFSFWRRRPERK